MWALWCAVLAAPVEGLAHQVGAGLSLLFLLADAREQRNAGVQ